MRNLSGSVKDEGMKKYQMVQGNRAKCRTYPFK